jgi:HAD superfamily hydrolase (TIGR01459 family)
MPSFADAAVAPAGLGAVLEGHDLILCDVWGVVHDGQTVFASAIDALRRARARGVPVVLLSNSPRPGRKLIPALDRLGVDRDAYDDIVTSGDVMVARLAAEAAAHRAKMGQALCVFLIGTGDDEVIFDGLDLAFTPLERADRIVVTGLSGDATDAEVEAWRAPLAAAQARGVPLICGNPDLAIISGGQRIPCAGAVAALYEALGGAVDQCGKPYAPIYDVALSRVPTATRPIAIGDAVATDLMGAARQGFPAIFIADGLHGAALMGESGLNETALATLLNGLPTPRLIQTALAW